jgi:hypothetical protein
MVLLGSSLEAESPGLGWNLGFKLFLANILGGSTRTFEERLGLVDTLVCILLILNCAHFSYLI